MGNWTFDPVDGAIEDENGVIAYVVSNKSTAAIEAEGVFSKPKGTLLAAAPELLSVLWKLYDVDFGSKQGRLEAEMAAESLLRRLGVIL